MTKDFWKDYYSKENIDFFGPVYLDFRKKRASVEAGFAVKVLGLKKGEKILDLCCGLGHNSVYFAKQGLEVVGVDYSHDSIRSANELTDQEGVKILFWEGDAQEIPWVGEFDAAVMLFNSFGYFQEEAKNARVAERLAAALKRSGRFLIEILNRDFAIVKAEKGWDEFDLEDGTHQKVLYHFDPSTSLYSFLRTITTKKGRRELPFVQRAYSHDESRKMLKDLGLRITEVYGDYEGAPWTPSAPTMIFTGLKG